jgi:transcriptional regulator with XRE-family HTH domain
MTFGKKLQSLRKEKGLSQDALANQLYVTRQSVSQWENDRTMPFNFGLHPAFNCPLQEGEKFEDYHIEFSNHETFDWLNTHIKDSKVMDLDKDALAATIIITDPVSSESSLTNGEHGVTVSNVG